GHDAGVTTLVTSSDGRWVATASCDLTVIIWDARGACISQEWIAHDGYVWDLAFSPDSRYIVSAGGDGKVAIWDISGSALQVASLEGHAAPCSNCAWSSDGAYIASRDIDGTLRLWDARTFQPLPLDGAEKTTLYPTAAAFSSESARVAVGYADRTICTWDMATRQQSLVLKTHGWVYDVVFSPDGRLLLSASKEQTMKVWDAHTGAMVHALGGHESRVWEVCFSPCGSYIASASEDETVRCGGRVTDRAWRRSPTTVTRCRMLRLPPTGRCCGLGR
ncbi:WD40 repeat-like protein, partial [Dichomitus squalens LYAD-421 SS1]